MATRNAINVLIKLLGGAEMTAELKTLGTTGETAIKKIDDAAKGVSLATLGGALHNFGSDIVSTFERVAAGIGVISVAVSAAAPFILSLAKSGAEAAQQAGDAAQAAGLQAASYQKLAFAAGEADVSQGQFNTAMASFNKQIVKTADETAKGAGKIGSSLNQTGADIKQGIGYTTQAFADIGVEVVRFGGKADKLKATTRAASTGFDMLGIKVKDAGGKLKDNETLLKQVADAFQKLPDGANKSAIAVKLFGIEGTKLIPFLNQGAKGIQGLEDEAARLGIIFSDDQIKAAEAFNNSLSELKKTTAGLSRQVGLIFAPAFAAAANAFRDIIVRNRVAILDFVRNGVQTATVFIKDFFATLSGRDADVTSNKWLITWRDNIVGFGQDFEHVATGVIIPAMTKLRAAADLTITAINGIFGTNITSGEVLIGATIFKLIGGFGLLRSAILLVVEAIAFLSTALTATPAGRIILAIAAALEVVIAVWERERAKRQGWISSTNAHKAALDELKAAIDAVKAGVPGAEENLKRLAQAHLDSARAALEDAKAQVAQQQQIVDAMKQGGEFAAPLGADIDTQTEALLRANINLAKRTRELDDVQKTLDGKVVGNIEDLRQGTAQAATGVTQLGTAADTSAAKVENLDHQITVFRGGGPGGQLSKETFDVIDGVAHRADQAKQSLDGVAASGKSAADNLKTVSNDVTNSIAAVPNAIKPDAAASAVDGIVTDVNKIAPAAQDAASGVNDALGSIDASSADQAATALVTPFESLPSKIGAIMSGLQGLIQGGFASLSSIVSSLASQINAQIASIISALQQAAAAAASLRSQAASSSSSDSGGSHGGFAGGGHVVGAGGPTSDSILAWLSNGEFVMQAAAVRRFGVGFLNALNQGFLPSLEGFSLGGFVDGFNRSMSQLAIPRMATGGLAPRPATGGATARDSATTTLHFSFPGTGEIFEAFTSDFVASRMTHAAVKAGLLSTGRKPKRS
ncbi:phage tail tape measure protein [Mesorhizobium huakuii]|uniref:Phage tail tape measure protein n=1 Tax=Mesorhizobium huakuii TaxID=28104 RepID=A0A7G6SUN9_9HYPH|nr:phage tail tape measure protein [Mesorhizobium huakuii]QND58221.1 phage tail tape measure protein [Mesorhizobium huakuii]